MKLKHILTEAKEVTPELKAFMDDFIAGTSQHPFSRNLRIWNDSVGIEASIWDNAIDLAAIMSFIEKGNGDASKALKWFTDLADKHGVPIELAVQPIKDAGAKGKSLSKAALTAWYKRNGFKSAGGEYMRREPKKLLEATFSKRNHLLRRCVESEGPRLTAEEIIDWPKNKEQIWAQYVAPPIAIIENRATPFNDKDMPDFSDDSYTAVVGTSDGYKIWGSGYDRKMVVYGILDDDRKLLAYISFKLQEQTVDGVSFHDIGKIWVKQDQRGKGLIASILDFIVKKKNTALGSGRAVTIDGEKWMRQMINKRSYKFKVFDRALKKMLPIEDVPSEKLFKFANDYELIFTESWGGLFDDCPHECKLGEMRKFRGDPIWD